MENTTNPKAFVATDEQIKQWKSKHGDVFRLSVDDEPIACYLRQPNRQEYSFLSKIEDPITFNETILKTCWLDGDKAIQTEDKYFLSVMEDLSILLDRYNSKMEKL